MHWTLSIVAEEARGHAIQDVWLILKKIKDNEALSILTIPEGVPYDWQWLPELCQESHWRNWDFFLCSNVNIWAQCYFFRKHRGNSVITCTSSLASALYIQSYREKQISSMSRAMQTFHPLMRGFFSCAKKHYTQLFQTQTHLPSSTVYGIVCPVAPDLAELEGPEAHKASLELQSNSWSTSQSKVSLGMWLLS